MTTERWPLTVPELRTFIYSGKADFSVINEISGEILTFKATPTSQEKISFNIEVKKQDLDTIFNIFKSNTSYPWTYLGIMKKLRLCKQYRNPQIQTETKLFIWLLAHLHTNMPITSCIKLVHNGKCGRCGRRLTDDKSLKQGFGPHCIKKVSQEEKNRLSTKFWQNLSTQWEQS